MLWLHQSTIYSTALSFHIHSLVRLVAGTAPGCSSQRQEADLLLTSSPQKSPATGRQLVAPCDIPEVLLYVISDVQYADLDKLHLVLMRDGSVQQLRIKPPPSGNQPKEKQFFMWHNPRSKELYDLMPASAHEQVQDSPAWRQIAK